jgi:hypothetical protein
MSARSVRIRWGSGKCLSLSCVICARAPFFRCRVASTWGAGRGGGQVSLVYRSEFAYYSVLLYINHGFLDQSCILYLFFHKTPRTSWLTQRWVPPDIACRSAVSHTRHCPSSQLLEPSDIACKSAKVEQTDAVRKPAVSDTVHGL